MIVYAFLFGLLVAIALGTFRTILLAAVITTALMFPSLFKGLVPSLGQSLFSLIRDLW